MQNKVLRRFLLPYYITSVSMFAFSGVAIGVANVPELTKLFYQEDAKFSDSNTNHLICAILLIISILFGWWGMVAMPKSVKKHANSLTYKYLQDIFTVHPELEQFKAIFKNKQSLQYMCAVACNGLGKQEQQQIINIIQQAINSAEKSDYNNELVFLAAENKILVIVKKYANTHPEYMKNLMESVAVSHKTYVLQQNVKTR